ncbi:MAG: hypothetical protein KDB03_03740 [Planctomycetales bacterium]|nr:hypothetical protein [Planctomycetales bacterium]
MNWPSTTISGFHDGKYGSQQHAASHPAIYEVARGTTLENPRRGKVRPSDKCSRGVQPDKTFAWRNNRMQTIQYRHGRQAKHQRRVATGPSP